MAALGGPWQLSFPPDLGAPASLTLERLAPWSASDQDGVKYFSGTATYTHPFDVQQAWIGAGDRLMLDLGDVRDLAQVSVNGKDLGVVWKPPYRVDITEAAHSGRNELTVKVTNEWTNRIMGDARLPNERKVLPGDRGGGGGGFGGFGGRGAQTPAPSGLLGPVALTVNTQSQE